ncbi:MAG: B12-binding domain-containing radical SAM protein [Acidobacteria bacterium]|nr:B12-binding domain-containing radical SAM protein [Acidobacteriota bacterium]
MNALLIYPEWPDTYWSFKHALPFEGKRSLYPPLGLMTIASLFPPHWKKRLVDTNIRPLTEDDLKWADVAMLSGMMIHKPELLQILERCRKRGLRTVIGGPVASSVAELPQHADHVVKGEAEELIADLCQGLENGTAKPMYEAAERPGLHLTPLPDISLINLKHYSAMAIQYSRGCPFNCEFCDIIEIYGRKPRTKSPDQVIAELEQLRQVKWRGSIFIVDDNFIGNKRMVKEMLPQLAAWNDRLTHPFTFYTEASMNLSDDLELLQMMKDARFTRVFLGIETPVEESLIQAQKQQNTRRGLLESVQRIQSYGMEVMAGFIVGFDNDPEEIFDKQVEFIKESAIPLAMVGMLIALPNTQLYRRLLKEGRIVEEGSGDNMDTRLNFIPKMNPEKLVEGYRSILRRIYNPEAYYDRARRFLAQAAPLHRTTPRMSDYVALLRSMVKQGVLSSSRRSYWKFFIEAATRYRHAFDRAITLAIMGHHFEVLTRIVCGPEPEPELER